MTYSIDFDEFVSMSTAGGYEIEATLSNETALLLITILSACNVDENWYLTSGLMTSEIRDTIDEIISDAMREVQGDG
jgi:hypothetical protein